MDYIPKPFTADELLTVIRRSLRCSMLMDEAESAGLPGNGSMSYVSCPINYYRLGYVSWVLMEDEGTARIGGSYLFLNLAAREWSLRIHAKMRRAEREEAIQLRP